MSSYFLQFPTTNSTRAIERIVSDTLQKHLREYECSDNCHAGTDDIKACSRTIIQDIKERIYQQIAQEQLLYKDDKESLSECIDMQARKLSSYIEQEVENTLAAIRKRQARKANLHLINSSKTDHYA